jgi:hypothetical protein
LAAIGAHVKTIIAMQGASLEKSRLLAAQEPSSVLEEDIIAAPSSELVSEAWMKDLGLDSTDPKSSVERRNGSPEPHTSTGQQRALLLRRWRGTAFAQAAGPSIPPARPVGQSQETAA